jgi:glucose-1-phosphate adenylyltransferase
MDVCKARIFASTAIRPRGLGSHLQKTKTGCSGDMKSSGAAKAKRLEVPMSFHSNGIPLSQTPVLILAGGTGERMFPLTVARPKPLLPLGPFRILDFTILNCRTSGLSGGVLLTQYKHDQLASYIRENWNGQFRCMPPVSGKRYRGTADAVFQNLREVFHQGSRHVLILSADHVYRMDYRNLLRAHIESDADATISTIRYPVSQAHSFGVVEVDENSRVMGFKEKPIVPRPLPEQPGTALVSMGIYVFKMKTLVSTLHAICGNGSGYDFGHDVLPSLVDRARVYSLCFQDELLNTPSYWRDIGDIDAYYKASMELAQANPPQALRALGIPGPRPVPSAEILGKRALVWRTMLCSGVRIEEDAVVEDSVLMPRVRVGTGARLRRVIVDAGVQIPAGFTVGMDPARDQERYTISPGGVTVVTATGSSATASSPLFSERTELPREGFRERTGRIARA